MKVIKTELVALDGEQAAKILEQYPYDRQRPVRADRVKLYAEQMREGHFVPGSEITLGFCPNGNGTLHGHLTNGRHRLFAVIEAKISQQFEIKHYLCDNEEDLNSLYFHTDIGLGRSPNDAYRAISLREEFGLPAMKVNALGAAVLFIERQFGKSRQSSIAIDKRLSLMRYYEDAAGRFFEVTAGCPRHMDGVIRRAATLSVAIVTFDESVHVFGQKKIEDFWHGAVHDDGIRSNDPRKVANTHLLTTSLSSVPSPNRRSVTPAYSARYLANCFNAFIGGRDISNTKVYDDSAPINIAGSKYNGK